MSQAASAQLQARLAAVGGEDMEDKVFLLSYDGTVTGGEFEIGEGSFDILLDDGESMTWNVPAPAGYSAGAALVCGEPDEDYENDEMPFSYVEYVSTTMGGGVLGSLDVFGSLGS